MFTTRFAPSPTGYLHLGHAFSAWTAYEAAQSQRGTFILRIEDTDQTRCKPEYEAALLEDLAWLGLTWPEPVRRQSAYLADYQSALYQLIEKQLVYRCFKTRKDIAAESANAPHGLQTIYIGSPLPPAEEDEHLSRGDAFAWRLSLTECRRYLGDLWDGLQFESDGERIKAQPELLGDIVIARKEFPTSYHLASVHDDARQGVTHVIRGEDLKEAAHLHVLLQALLGYPQPIYHHHRLLLDEDGKRFAKRNQSVTLRALRENGTSARQLREQLGFITNEE